MSFPVRRVLPSARFSFSRPSHPSPPPTSTSTLPFPQHPVHSSLSFFSTSIPSSESKTKRKARLIKKNHLEKKAALKRSHDLAEPNPILGYAPGHENLWDNCLLKSVLLDRNEVWGAVVDDIPGEDQHASSPSSSSSPSSTSSTSASDDTTYVPKHFNFGLDHSTVTELAQNLPLVSTHQAFANLPKTKFEQLAQSQVTHLLEQEEDKKAKLLKVLDLKNASSKGIAVENTRRIVKAFGRTPQDSGLPEVQAAVMTARIHSLHAHLLSQPKDILNQRPLRDLVQKRSKILKYLRSLDVKRYEDCLEKIGVEPRAVEGEVIISKKTMRDLIRPSY